jgi:hypothetical protein
VLAAAIAGDENFHGFRYIPHAEVSAESEPQSHTRAV